MVERSGRFLITATQFTLTLFLEFTLVHLECQRLVVLELLPALLFFQSLGHIVHMDASTAGRWLLVGVDGVIELGLRRLVRPGWP